MEELQLPEETPTDKLYNLLKGTIGMIPYAGSIASEVFGMIVTSPIVKRRQKWSELVVSKLKELEETKAILNIDELAENEEFISFLMEASDIAIKSHQLEKLEALRNSIGNYFTKNSLDFDKKFSFLKVVEQITPTHLKILLFIAKNDDLLGKERDKSGEQDEEIKINCYEDLYQLFQNENIGIDKYHFRKCVVDLESYSLLRVNKDFRDFISGGGYATDTGAPQVKILDFGVEFIQFISS
ncbi:hypothetical protein [Flavobacterium sp. 25HG05S-40]|uniref:hypothetical protein n=1 Tax=Flavobacterium sp. 25HG05S-40 TaxID=3458682 RepID=UPI0040447A1C